MKKPVYRPPLLERHPWVKPACWTAIVVLALIPQTIDLVLCTIILFMLALFSGVIALGVFGPTAMMLIFSFSLVVWVVTIFNLLF